MQSISFSHKKNLPIEGLDAAKDLGAIIFHAGTTEVDGKILTSGGRVLGVTVTAENIQAAIEKAYKCVDVIKFENMHYRKDISARALKNV